MGTATEVAVVVGKKGKHLAKSKLKNILSRPDRDLWPALSEKQSEELARLISKYQVDVITRPPWSALKLMPKLERPKSKLSGATEGLIFGIAQVARLLKSDECTGVILDEGVNPRVMVKHIIEAASERKIPVVCMVELKKVTSSSFGFPSCCLALRKSDRHEDIKSKVLEFWKAGKWVSCDQDDPSNENTDDKMVIDRPVTVEKVDEEPEIPFEYLIRISKNCRAFVPPSNTVRTEITKEFSGQNYIQFSKSDENVGKSHHAYKGMIVKRVSSNPNRKKKKAKSKINKQ